MNRPSDHFTPKGSAPARFSAAEFLRMAGLGAFEGMKVELVEGELVRMTPPFAAHGAMQARLIGALLTAAQECGLVVFGDTGVRLGPDTIRAFDVALVEPEAAEADLVEPRQVRLAVEIAGSTLETDLGDKLRDYARAAIPLYWVVDLKARVVHVMAGPSPDGYAQREVVRFGEPLTVPGSSTPLTIE